MPFHVPATDLTSDTMTGVTGPTLAQPTNVVANPTKTVRTVQSDRAPLGFIAGSPSRSFADSTVIFFTIESSARNTTLGVSRRTPNWRPARLAEPSQEQQ